MPALRFQTCRLLSGNVWNKELTIAQRRILRKLRRKKGSIKKKIYSRRNRNNYIQLQTTRKLSLFYGNLPITKMHRRIKRTSYIPFLLNLETRLDVILVRLHFCETLPQARQLISHRKVCVNNGIVNISTRIMYLLIAFLSLLGSSVARVFGRFLENTLVTQHSFSFLLLLFLTICILIFFYRRQRKETFSLLFKILIHFLVLLFCCFFRFVLLEQIFFLGGVVTATYFLQHSVSSGSSSGELSGPPPLESSSSTESLNTYRNIIAANNEAQIYQRIQALEARLYYNIPPQNEGGEYEGIVRDHFDQALHVDHYVWIFDRESFELRVLEQKGLLQDRLFELMLSQDNLSNIYKICLHTQSDIRKEAYEFLQDKLEPFSDPSSADQRNRMSSNLNSFLAQLNEHGRNAEIYREFYRHFTDEDCRRSLGLPLP